MEDFERQEDFEQKLRDALARKEPPAWFESKVLAAVAPKRPKVSLLRWALVASLAVAIPVAVWTDQRERAAGEAARARLQLALRITVTQLSKIQKTVRASTEDE
jgi:hypothetical protein